MGNAFLLLTIFQAAAVEVAGAGAEDPRFEPEIPPVSAAALLKDPAMLLRWVEEHHAEVAAAGARVLQGRADLGASRLVPNPVLDLGLGDVNVGPSNPHGLGFNDTSVYSVGITELIEIGKREPRIRSAQLREEAARTSRQGLLELKTAEARRAIGRVVHARARAAALDENLAANRRVVELERTRADHGDLSRNDFDRLLLDTAALEIEAERGRTEYRSARSEAREALYAPLDDEGTRMEDLDVAVPLPAKLPAIAAAVADRPEVRAAELGADSARQDEVLARRRVLPDLSFRFGYTHDNLTSAGNQEDTVSFSIAIPLPLFDRGQHAAALAAGRAAELREQRRALIAGARADLEELEARREYLEATLRRLQAEELPRSAAVLESTLRSLDRGQVSMTDLLLARRTHLSLLLNVMDLRFEAFNVRSDLRRALGLERGPEKGTDARPESGAPR